MKTLLPIIFLLFVSGIYNTSTAQTAVDDSSYNIALMEDSTLMTRCLVFVDSSNQLTPEQTTGGVWTRLADLKIKSLIPRSWITKKVFLQFRLENSGNTATTIYFTPGLVFRSIKTFLSASNGRWEPMADSSQDDGFQPLLIEAHTAKSFLIALEPAKTVFNYINPIIIRKEYLAKYKNIHFHTYANQQILGYLFSGVMLMMFFFSLANYLLSVKKEFLFNGCYTASMFLLVFLTTIYERQSGVWASFFESYLAFVLLAIGTIFYIAFTRKFLDTKENYSILDKIFVGEEWGVFIVVIIFSFLHFFSNNFQLQNLLENIMKVTALLIGIVYIVFALTQKNKLLNYLAIGNLVLIVGSIISFYILLHPMGRKSIFTSAISYYELGITGELMFFLLGLTYKNRIELIGKIKEQEALKLESEKQAFETKLAVLNAKQKERNRISADMHDELGAGITAIRLYSELAKSKAETAVMPEIEKISDSANELLTNMNAIIWAMSSNNDSLENMVAYIRSYSQEYFENTGIKCKIEIEEGLPEMVVWGEFRKNVFLVIKEALNNILKHAKATEVNIELKKVPEGISLFIQDDGIGIDLEKVRRFGNGLNNMKKRMNEMQVQFSIENHWGTLVTLHYPIDWHSLTDV